MIFTIWSFCVCVLTFCNIENLYFVFRFNYYFYYHHHHDDNHRPCYNYGTFCHLFQHDDRRRPFYLYSKKVIVLFLVINDMHLFLAIWQNLNCSKRTNLIIVSLRQRGFLKPKHKFTNKVKYQSYISPFVASQRPENDIYFDLISALHTIPHFIHMPILGLLGSAAVS
jgi:hypothetical protein